MNHFFSWAKREGEKVATKAQLPKLPKTERDKLVVRILADTGLRVVELLGLRTNDLVEQNRNYYLKVRRKGGRRPARAGAPTLPATPDLRRAGPATGRCEQPDLPSHRRRPNGDYQP